MEYFNGLTKQVMELNTYNTSYASLKDAAN
jgi:hypothetical protein